MHLIEEVRELEDTSHHRLSHQQHLLARLTAAVTWSDRRVSSLYAQWGIKRPVHVRRDAHRWFLGGVNSAPVMARTGSPCLVRGFYSSSCACQRKITAGMFMCFPSCITCGQDTEWVLVNATGELRYIPAITPPSAATGLLCDVSGLYHASCPCDHEQYWERGTMFRTCPQCFAHVVWMLVRPTPDGDESESSSEPQPRI